MALFSFGKKKGLVGPDAHRERLRPERLRGARGLFAAGRIAAQADRMRGRDVHPGHADVMRRKLRLRGADADTKRRNERAKEEVKQASR